MGKINDPELQIDERGGKIEDATHLTIVPFMMSDQEKNDLESLSKSCILYISLPVHTIIRYVL